MVCIIIEHKLKIEEEQERLGNEVGVLFILLVEATVSEQQCGCHKELHLHQKLRMFGCHKGIAIPKTL